MIEQKNVEKYAFYQIDKKDYYQYLPTSKLEDVVYVSGMKSVCEKHFIEDDGHFIEIPTKETVFGVGEVVSSLDIVRRYYEGVSFFQHYDSETIEYLKENPNREWNLDGEGEATLGCYSSYIKVNHGEVPVQKSLQDIILGSSYWYVELHQEDGTVCYEKTVYNDKKYRGQNCQFYELVEIVEYELNGIQKKAIIRRENKKYPYKPVEMDSLDEIIDSSKGLISHQLSFNGFNTSPLYSFNTEDSASVFCAKKPLIANQNVVTVTGSGDAILDLFLNGVSKIIAFDTNVFTVFYAELKFIAAKQLSFQQFCLFFSSFNETIYRKLEPHLSVSTKKFWNELYSYCKIVDMPLKDAEKGGLFYPTASIFAGNDTMYNPNGYYTEENYARLQRKLQTKSLEDIQFVNCDLLELPKAANLSNCSYAYLSNIMDFMVGVDDMKVDNEKLVAFKEFILKRLYPSLKESSVIDLSYIKASWHNGIEAGYYEVYKESDGFQIEELSNGRDSILSFNSSVLEKEVGSQKS